jgi:hypothetical protein
MGFQTGLLRAAVVAAVLGLGAAPGMASTCSPANVTSASACAGEISGNDKDTTGGNGTVNVNTFNDPLPTLYTGYVPAFGEIGLFGQTTWNEVGRVDRPGTEDGTLNLTYDAGNKSGGWSIDGNWAGITSAMLVIKGSNGFIAYLLDLTSTSGTWSTVGLVNNGGNRPAISHGSLYTVAAVPVPAAGFMLLAGIGGLAALRRRRKAA